MFRALLCVGSAAVLAAAQAPTFPHVVLTRLTGATQAQLVEVQPQTGLVQLLGGFPSDTLPPLALAVDPFDGALLVALDQGGGTTRIVRLVRAGPSWFESLCTQLTGRVSALDVAGQDLLVVLDDPVLGVHRAPRRGGAATPVFPWANLTAVHSYGPSSMQAMVAFTGRPGTASPDSGTGVLDMVTGAFVYPPGTFPNPNGLEVTGVVDLPTGVPRQLLSFADGSFALFASFISSTPQPVPTSVPIPAGGAVAMHPAGSYSVAPVALGGAAFPYLYSVDAFSGAVGVLSAALPGAPVDFAWGLSTDRHAEFFGERCGATLLTQGYTGSAQLGGTLTLYGQGLPASLVLLAAGLDDFAFGVLPVPLPGGCLLQVTPDVVLALVTNASGWVTQPIAIPASPLFVGTVVFTQWAALDPSGFSTSAALASWVGY